MGIDLDSLSPIPGSRWLHYVFVRGYVCRLSSLFQAQDVVNGHNSYTGLSAIPSIPPLKYLWTWSRVRQEVARYLHHVHKTPISYSFLKMSVLLWPPATIEEARPGPSDPTCERNQALHSYLLLLHLRALIFPSLTLLKLILLDGQKRFATSLRSMPKSGLMWLPEFLARIAFWSPWLINAYLMFLRSLLFLIHHLFWSHPTSVFPSRCRSPSALCRLVLIFNRAACYIHEP